MQRLLSALLFLFLASSAWAQATIPGTFNTPSAQPGVVTAAPLLTPPIISYGAGANGPAIINGQAVATGVLPGSAENASLTQGFISASGYVPMPRPALLPVRNAQTASASQTGERAPAPFDYVVAPSSGRSGETSSGAGVGDTSLGQLAATLRKGPPPTQRKFSNDDIARINGATNSNNSMPGASTTQPPYPQQQQQQQPGQMPPHSDLGSAPLPPGAKPSPFSPRPMANVNPPNSQADDRSQPTQLAQNTMPQQPAAQSAQEPAPQDSTSQDASSASAQASAQASSQRQLPASGSLLPFFAMLGGAATLAGYVLAKRR